MKRRRLGIAIILLSLVSCTSYSYEVGKYTIPGVITSSNEYVSPLHTKCFLTMYNQKQLDNVKEKVTTSIQKTHCFADSYHFYDGINNISTINNSSYSAIKVDPSLIKLLKKGIELTKLTKGVFNITMGNVIDLWSDALEKGELFNHDPSEGAIRKSLESILSYQEIDQYLILNEEVNTVTLKNKEASELPTKINLGGLSKGFALYE